MVPVAAKETGTLVSRRDDRQYGDAPIVTNFQPGLGGGHPRYPARLAAELCRVCRSVPTRWKTRLRRNRRVRLSIRLRNHRRWTWRVSGRYHRPLGQGGRRGWNEPAPGVTALLASSEVPTAPAAISDELPTASVSILAEVTALLAKFRTARLLRPGSARPAPRHLGWCAPRRRWRRVWLR